MAVAWTELSQAPYEQWTPTSVNVGNKIYVFGSGDDDPNNNMVQIYDITSGQWSRGTNMPNGRYNPACVAYGNNIYVIGGQRNASESNPNFLRLVEIYNTTTNTWSTGSSPTYPTARTIGIVGTRIYLFGTYSNGSDWTWETFGTRVQAYDISSNSWSVVNTTMQIRCYSLCSANTIGSKILLLSDHEQGPFRAYDTSTNFWEILSSFPVKGGYDIIASTLFEGKVHATGPAALYSYISSSGWKKVWNTSDYDSTVYFFPQNGRFIGVTGSDRPRIQSMSFIAVDSLDPRPIDGVAPTVNTLKDNRFSWQYLSSIVSSTYKNAVVEWRSKPSDPIKTASSSQLYIDFPAGQLPMEALQWRVKAFATNGMESNYSEWVTLNVLQHTVTVNSPSPSSGDFDYTQQTTFTWGVKSETFDASQSRAEFQWRPVGGSITTVNIPSPEGRYIAPANTFPDQDIQWRIRVTTTVGLVTPYTEWMTLKRLIRTVTIINPSPASGFLNEHEDNVFAWNIETYPQGYQQTYAEFQWRPKGGSSRTIIINSNTMQTVVPAETFPNGTIEWRVRANAGAGFLWDWSPWMEISTIDQIHGKPYNLQPSQGKRNGTKNIVLSWVLRSYLSTPQKAFEVQYRYTNTSWTALSGKVNSSTLAYTVIADTFKPLDGLAYWRVRTYNSDNVAGEWSDPVSFIVLTAPQVPQWISVEGNKSRPICRWTSVNQIGWQMTITQNDQTIYDTGEQYGNATEHKVSDYLNNDTYRFRLRIINDLGLWSEWAVRTVTVNANKRFTITLSADAVPYAALLTFRPSYPEDDNA